MQGFSILGTLDSEFEMAAHVYADITKLMEKWISEGVSPELQEGALQQALDDVKARVRRISTSEAAADDESFDNMPV